MSKPECRGLPKLAEGGPRPATPKPVSLDGTSVQAKGLGRDVLISDDVAPGQTYEQTIELAREPQTFPDYRNPQACGLSADRR